MKSRNIFEALPYSNAFMRYKGFYELLQTTIMRTFLTLQQDVGKVSLYNLGYICTFLKLLFYSELNGVIFNFVGQRNHKLWPYN